MQLRSGKFVYNGLPLKNEKKLMTRIHKFADCLSDIKIKEIPVPPPPTRIGMTLRSRVIVLPEKGNEAELDKIKLKSDYNMIMLEFIGHRIKQIENLKSLHEDRDYLDKCSIIYEIYYTLNYYSYIIFNYMKNVEEEITKLLIMKFLERIQVMYNQIQTLPQTPEFIKKFDRLYDIWDQTLHTYEELYV